MDMLTFIQNNSFLLSSLGIVIGIFIGMSYQIKDLKRRVASLHVRQDKLEGERIKKMEDTVEYQGKLLSAIEERTKNMLEMVNKIDSRIENYLLRERIQQNM